MKFYMFRFSIVTWIAIKDLITKLFEEIQR